MHRVTGVVTRAEPIDGGDPLGGGAVVSTTCFAHPAADPPTVSSLFAAVKANAPRHAMLAQISSLGREACLAMDDGGHTLTHWAAKRGDAVVLAAVLNRGALVSAPSADDVGMVPLHWACTEGNVDCLRVLVDHGADIDARDRQGCTPLLVASQWGRADAVAFLVRIGADVRIFDCHDDSALHWACFASSKKMHAHCGK